MIKECKNCGKEFETNYKLQKCCSHACAIQLKTVVKKCEYCGKEFKGRISRKFCSESCQNKARYKERTLKRVCPVCGSEFVGNGRKKYCSLFCASKVEYRYYQKKERGSNETLCWNCKKATGNCSWSRNFTPVKGWKAKKVKIKESRMTGQSKYQESYIVKSCPEYQKG